MKENNVEFFKLLTNLSFDIISVLSSDGTIISESNATERILGYKSGKRNAKNVFDFVHPEDKNKAISIFKKQIELPDTTQTLEFRYQHENGKWIWLEAKGQNLLSNKEINGIIVNSRDITEKKIKFKSIFSASPDAMLLADRNTGCIVDANLAAAGLFETDLNNIIGKHQSELHPQEQQEQSETSFKYQPLNEDELAPPVEIEIVTAKNTRKTIEIRGKLFTLNNHEYVLGNFRDITERIKDKQDFIENEEKLKSIIENSTNIFFQHDANHVLSYLSPQIKDILGYEPEEAMVLWTKLATDNPINELGFQSTEKALKTGQAQEPFELELKHKSGKNIWIEVREAPVLENGKAIAIVGALTDITDRKKADQTLRESEANLQFLNTMVNEAFNLKDLNSIYTYISSKLREVMPNAVILFLSFDSAHEETRLENVCGINNQLFEKLLHIMPFNPIGKKFKLLPEYREMHKTGKLVEFENGLAEFSAKQFPSLAAKSIEKLIGIHKIYTIGILKGENLLANFHFFTFNKKEITNSEFIEAFVKEAGLIIQIKQAEIKLKEANDTKDKFFKIISHDLKTPFNSILGFSDLALTKLKTQEYDKVHNYSGIIKQTTQHTLILLDNLLEWSRLQTGSIEFKPKTADLYHLITTTTKLLSATYKEKNMQLFVHVPKDLTVFADEFMFATIIRNLLSNAIKFSHENGWIKITAKQESEKTLIEIEDNGTGISMENIEKLFKIEHSFSSPGTRQEKGTGLGLILCKEFIEKHGGKIWVKSKINTGTKFSFTI